MNFIGIEKILLLKFIFRLNNKLQFSDLIEK